MRSLRLVTVGLDAVSGRTVVLFEELGGTGRLLQLEVEPARALAIEAAWRGGRVAPAVLGLLGRLRAEVGHGAVRVVIGLGAAGRWTATVLLADGGQVLVERSDAVLLALADGVPITAEDDLLGPARTDGDLTPEQREELDRFRRFLDGVVPADFTV